MYLKSLELIGFKSFGRKSVLDFSTPITAVVGPNGSGKSNTAEAFRFVLGEQSIKSLRGKRGEDLIWGGSSEVPRSNRASVKAVFDNTKRLLDIDFDEVVIERVVFRDGVNEYFINGTKVRLKDVLSLLSGANIGASGHHIISQGEADRIIAATPRERRGIVEDALGLRVYQYKKEESIKKLEKTEENKAQVESLRKENAPHLRFLERQMQKLEKAKSLREELVVAYHEYLKREEQYLGLEKETIQGLRDAPYHKLKTLEVRMKELRDELEKTKKGDQESKELLALEKKISTLRFAQTDHVRSLGRIEGQIAFEERRVEEEKKRLSKEEGTPVSYKDAKHFWESLTALFDSITDVSDFDAYKKIIHKAQDVVIRFIHEHHVQKKETVFDERALQELYDEKKQHENHIASLTEEIEATHTLMRGVSERVEKEKNESRDVERELFGLVTEQSELRGVLAHLDSREATLRRDEEEFKREIAEGIVLIGSSIRGYKEYTVDHLVQLDLTEREERDAQHERRRSLEKMKIRFEEIGGGATDEMIKEYTEVKERDAFLEKELNDLTHSSDLLRKLITNLEQELEGKFKNGLSDISTQFNAFFVLMFGGGSANLRIVKEKQRSVDEGEESGDDEGVNVGVDIEVSLPKKRIQSLMMLSGGERALTSIALIFAMSQVNPPPFLILDETDAALDEANSRRYGDMIYTLSKKSQLIVITHNRETMSRADVLYGITMGIDGVSRILSVKLDDAVAVAK